VGSVALHERSVQWGAEVAVRLAGRFWLGLGVSMPISGRNALDAPVLGLGLIRWDNGQGAG